MLANRNKPELLKFKNYKEAMSHKYSYQKDWQKAMQDKIDVSIKNNTWSLSTLLYSF